MKRILPSCVLLFVLVASLSAQEGPQPTEADKAFFRDFKRAALAGDSAWISAHICFPVRATIDGHTRLIATPAEFTSRYGQLIPLETLDDIRRQSADTLIRTRQGVMIADGAIWFDADPTAPAEGTPKVCIVAFGISG